MTSRSEPTEPLNGGDPDGQYAGVPAGEGDLQEMAGDTYCANCGTELPEGARFCPSCGAARGAALGPTVIDEPAQPPAPPPVDEPAPPPATPRVEEPVDEASPTRVDEPPRAPKPPRIDESPQSPVQPRIDRSPPSPVQSPVEVPPASRAGEPREDAPPPRSEPAPDRAAQSGDAAEFARRLKGQARRPAVAVALGGGALAALVTLAFGLVFAVAFPDEDTLIGVLGADANLVTETLRQSVSFLQISFDGLAFGDAEIDLHGRTAPLLLLLVPVGACALAAKLLTPRTHGSNLTARLISAAGIALAFAILMLIAALLSGDADPSLPGTFFAALLWGALGALAGSALALRGEGAGLPAGSRPAVPPAAQRAVQAAVSSLRALLILLVVTGVLGTAAWVTFALTNDGGDDQRARATVEVALFAADHSVHFAELGAFVGFEPAREELEEVALPAPTEDPDEITGSDGHRIFAYRDALPAYLFVPAVILLIALPLLLALYAGFAVAGRVGATGAPLTAAAWGAVVGPVWAVTMAILDVLATKSLEVEALGRSEELALFGSADGAGAFLFFLLVGGVLGALGGLLAGSTAADTGAAGGRSAG